MRALAQQRCFNHALREAAARCPACGHFYCRECITEHDDRVICATCLAKVAVARTSMGQRFAPLLRIFQFLVGFLLIWVFFYWVGGMLLSISSSSHKSGVWQGKWLEEP